MTQIKEFFKRHYLAKVKEEPDLFIGVELEYPIVNRTGGAASISLCMDLMAHLADQPGFRCVKLDDEGHPIELERENGDIILFEVTYNTLEFAFARAVTIAEVETRLMAYLELIQAFLAPHQHAIEGLGINPNWRVNDHRPVATGRYQMLMDYLKLSRNYPTMHPYLDYAGFICGNQVQFDISRDTVIRVLNAFNKIEAVKAYLFANSAFDDLPELAISRDYFWEQSMHGMLAENVGIYPRDFQSEEDYLSYQEETAMFYVERGGDYFYFEPVPIREFLDRGQIEAYDKQGNTVFLIPELADLKTHRSYHYQELTGRGTVEFRSICTQPLDRTFAPIAFHLGLLVNLEAFEDLLENTTFYQVCGQDYRHLRQQFSKKDLPEQEEKAVRELATSLLACASAGLKERGYDEEVYLEPLKIRLVE